MAKIKFLKKLLKLIRGIATQIPTLIKTQWEEIQKPTIRIETILTHRDDNTAKTTPSRAIRYVRYLEHQANNGGYNSHVRDLLLGAAHEITRLHNKINKEQKNI